MSNTLLNLETVELVSTLRTAPKNGSPSSQDYNDYQRETLSDLAAITALLNDSVLPLVNKLLSSALADNLGIQGSTIISDTEDQSALFYNARSNTALSIADSLRVLQGMLTTFGTTLTNQGVQLAALQARLSTTNQNDISLAIQSIIASMSSLTARLNTLQTEVQNIVAGVPLTATTTTLMSVTSASSIIFDASASSGLITFDINLTSNVASSTLIGPTHGQIVTFIIRQDSTGNHTFSWPSNVITPSPVRLSASSVTAQSFIVGVTGNLYPISTATFE